MKVVALAVASLLAPLVTGCAGPSQFGGSPNLQVKAADALPIPTRKDLASSDRPYLIGPFDKLTIDVFGVQELSREVQADASGRISMPLVGSVAAAGRTPQELASDIAARLATYVKHPQVSVNLKETVSQVITVDGQVNKPGLYPVIGRMTLLRAVATAEGANEYAKLQDVVVFRTVNGQQMAARFDLKAIRAGQYEDPEVFANDVVLVGNNTARRLFRDALTAAPAVFTPLVYLLAR